jgi:hypothetical protein
MVLVTGSQLLELRIPVNVGSFGYGLWGIMIGLFQYR